MFKATWAVLQNAMGMRCGAPSQAACRTGSWCKNHVLGVEMTGISSQSIYSDTGFAALGWHAAGCAAEGLHGLTCLPAERPGQEDREEQEAEEGAPQPRPQGPRCQEERL